MADGGNPDLRNSTGGENTDSEYVQKFLDELANKERAVSEATGSLRSRIGQILKEEAYNKAAFAQIRTIDKMSDTSRADFLRTFYPMFVAMYEDKWRIAAEDMLSDGEGEE